MAKTLKELGYASIREAKAVPEAKTVLASDKIDMIISDWNMPGGSGLDLLNFVRSKPEYSKIPFIMNTTEQEKKKIFQAVKSGAQAYLFKPVKKDLLAQKLFDLSKTHGIQPPKHKVAFSPPPNTSPEESEDSEKTGREDITFGSQSDFSKKIDVTIDDKKCTIYPGENITDSLPDKLKEIFPNLRIALVADTTDVSAQDQIIKEIKEKFDVKFVLKL